MSIRGGGVSGGALRNAADGEPRHAFVRTTDGIVDADWDDLTGAFADLHSDQTAWGAARPWNSQASTLQLMSGGEPVGGARLVIMTLPGFRSGLAYLKFGPFWRRAERTADIGVYRAVLEAVVEEYCERRGHCVSVLPRPNPEFFPLECEVLEQQGFTVRRKFSDPNRYLVDLALSEDEQMKSLDKRWRYNLRQALANGIEIRFCEDAREWAAFRSLYQSTVERKNFASPPSEHWLAGDNTKALPHLRPRLIMGFHEGRPLVGAAVGVFGDTAYYMFGASAPEALELEAGYALQWEIVRWLSANGATRWYDLGGEVGDQGLRRFKKGLAGKRGAIVAMRGEFDRWTGVSGRIAADLIFALRAAQRAVRDWR